ncbi:hypothetical protein E2C01_041443 [Portunus trituberculatus]|uniref:Uncharacterized protein n=1 Tax=Portunus trituberculatus TaxID=210409 RepID=A0A5B7FQY5_PORTR|nr:hypothetical protein [Portunus trituberculatus]
MHSLYHSLPFSVPPASLTLCSSSPLAQPPPPISLRSSCLCSQSISPCRRTISPPRLSNSHV